MNCSVGNVFYNFLPIASMIQKKLEKLIKTTSARFNKKKTLRQIKMHPNNIVVNIGDAYAEQLSGVFNNEERTLLEKIDNLRSRLLSSNEVITFDQIGGLKDGEGSLQKVSLTISEICRSAATPEKWGEFQFRLIRKLRPSNCLELGTNLGISGSYILSALSLNNNGFLITLEGNEKFASIASANMSGLTLTNFEIATGMFNETLPVVLGEKRLFDYVFIDGHHDKNATIAYYQMIQPHLADNSVIIFDDINWSAGMQEAWAFICSENGITAAFDFYKLGIVVYSLSWQQPAAIYKLIL